MSSLSTRKRALVLVAVLSAAMITEGCASCAAGMIVGREAGEAGTTQFHKDWNDAKWDNIVKYCDPQMFESTPEPKLRKFFSAVHDKLGKQVSATQGTWRANASTSGNYYIVEYQTKFEKGDATERFVWRIHGTQAKLAGWNVNSDALLDPSLRQ